MADKDADIQDDAGEQPKKKGSKMMIIIIGVLVIVLGAGGFVGYKLFASKPDAEAEKKKVEETKTTTVALDPFVLNLADRGRYLKVTIQLEVADESLVEKVEAKTPQLRDTIITLVSSKSINSISSPEGKFQLKDEILFRANQVMGGEKEAFKNLYFTEFVMQ
jgi:flagellar FliL protein